MHPILYIYFSYLEDMFIADFNTEEIVLSALPLSPPKYQDDKDDKVGADIFTAGPAAGISLENQAATAGIL